LLFEILLFEFLFFEILFFEFHQQAPGYTATTPIGVECE